MILIGFLFFLLAGIAIIVWLDIDFYFNYRAEKGDTVFHLLVSFGRKRIYYLIIALASLVTGIGFGIA